MSDMKCLFCQQELESVLRLAGAGGLVEEAYLLCSKCNIRSERKLWQELIRTRKALDVAVDALKISRDCAVITSVARGLEPKEDEINIAVTKALEQITLLEQKE